MNGSRLSATVEVAGKVLSDQSLIKGVVGRADQVALAGSAQHHPVKRRCVEQEFINGCRNLGVAAREEVIDADHPAIGQEPLRNMQVICYAVAVMITVDMYPPSRRAVESERGPER